MGVVYSEVHSDSISDTDFTERTNVIDYVNKNKEVMTDRRFAIKELCSTKRIAPKRPKQKRKSSIQ